MKKIIVLIIVAILSPIGVMAQITYANRKLSINNAPDHNNMGLTIDTWGGMYWRCKAYNFFQLDVSSEHPRIAGTRDEIVFYNTDTGTFNNIQVASIYNHSDARAKENVRSLTAGLSKILQLRPVTYNWKTTNNDTNLATKVNASVAYGPVDDNQQQYGFLAQEVETVLPEAVKTDDEGHKMINYIAIIPMLVQAIQELQATVESQANMLSIMKNQNNNENAKKTSNCKIISCSSITSSNEIEIRTEIDRDAKKAMLLITNLTGTKEATLPITQASTIYNTTNLKPGIYIVSLYVNGMLVDSTRMIKE